MFKGIENIPFFLYHMFSTEHPVQTNYPLVLIKVDSSYYDQTKLSNREYEMLIGSVDQYITLKKYGDPMLPVIHSRVAALGAGVSSYFQKQLINDSTSINRYPTWWAEYFSMVSGLENKLVTVVKADLSFSPTLKKSTNDSIVFTVTLPDGN